LNVAYANGILQSPRRSRDAQHDSGHQLSVIFAGMNDFATALAITLPITSSWESIGITHGGCLIETIL